jgi:hypothetical protein
MRYYLRARSRAGHLVAMSTTPGASLEAAMATACAVFRHDIEDVWIDDENGQKVADVGDIKRR